jgi:hypothetical protein
MVVDAAAEMVKAVVFIFMLVVMLIISLLIVAMEMVISMGIVLIVAVMRWAARRNTPLLRA